jgi:hypothetical protein
MAHSGNSEAFGQEHPPQRMGMSAEERRVLNECSSEAFWYRAVPGSILGGGLAALAINKGFISPSLRFGIYPKVMGAATVAFFLGKMSYSNECAKKFLTQAPNSEIARAIRKNRLRARGGGYDDTADLDTLHADAMAKSAEFKQPEMFDEAKEERAAAGNSSPSMTYDQLREAHRRQDSRRPMPVAPPQPDLHRQREMPSDHVIPAPDGLSAQTERPRRRRLNKYGDEVLED